MSQDKKEANFAQRRLLKSRLKQIEEVSNKISGIVRQLAIGGIAILWVFNKTDKGQLVQLHEHVNTIFLFFTLALLCDLLHYLIQLSINALYTFTSLWKKHIPDWLGGMAWVFWVIKILLVLAGYVMINVYLVWE